jgi:ferredoxin
MIEKVQIDTPTCIGCGTCWVVCPEVFREVEIGDEFKAATTGRLAAEKIMRETAEGCPSLSIILFDGAGVELYPTEAKREELRQRLQW